MLACLVRTLIASLAGLGGALVIGFSSSGSPWQNAGAFVLVLSAVAVFFYICEGMQLVLEKLGVSVYDTSL